MSTALGYHLLAAAPRGPLRPKKIATQPRKSLVASEQILKDRYEVIVIGTGIGGLAAASILAHEGLDVLVLERSSQPGGCCSSFSVADFTFDTAASILQGFGEVGYHVQRTLFDFVGQQVDLTPRDSAYAMYFGEERVEFHRDRHAFTAELGALFPQQAGSLLSYMRELDHIYQAFLDCSGPPRPPGDEPALQRAGLFLRHPMSVMRLRKYARISARRVFERYCDDPMATAFFDAELHVHHRLQAGRRLGPVRGPRGHRPPCRRHTPRNRLLAADNRQAREEHHRPGRAISPTGWAPSESFSKGAGPSGSRFRAAGRLPRTPSCPTPPPVTSSRISCRRSGRAGRPLHGSTP